MKLFDTHTHLYLPEFDTDGGGEGAVARAVEAGVEAMLMPNVDLSTIAPLRKLQAACPGRVYAAMGQHPTEVKDSGRRDVAEALAAVQRHQQQTAEQRFRFVADGRDSVHSKKTSLQMAGRKRGLVPFFRPLPFHQLPAV